MQRNKNENGSKTRLPTWRRNRTIEYGTWNVRSINGKEAELVDEIKKTNVKYLAITETKKKGQGCEIIKDGFVLLYSGVAMKERARAGVGFLIHKDMEESICEWKFVNERIMSLRVKEENNFVTLVAAYAPTEDETAEEKDKFFDKLHNVIDDITTDVILLGDLNGRVGNNPESYENVIGRYGENELNNNGTRLLQLCIANNLVIANTMFPHKNIHRYTREEPTRNEKSVIDYIIIRRNQLLRCRDARVKRGPEIGSDHYLLVLCRAVEKTHNMNGRQRNMNTKIRIAKLKSNTAQEHFRRTVSEKSTEITPLTTTDNVDTIWKEFKKVILDSAKDVCGESKCGGRHVKATTWWNDALKVEVNEKKMRWKNYLSDKTTEKYNHYKEQRIKVKELVRLSKSEAWEEFGRFLEESHNENQKLFYRTIKNLRRPKDCPIKFIRSKEGELLRDDKKIMERWRDYFIDLLNGESNPVLPENFILPEDEEDPGQITNDELIKALNKMKLGKAAGHDGIAPELLKYMGEDGQILLLKVINAAWRQATIPSDWQVAIINPIFKKGDNQLCQNHRGISLLTVAGKIYSRILTERLKSEIEHQLEEEQCGFRSNRGTQDLIFTMRQITEKTIEFNTKTHCCFIDLEKAFDTVKWDEIWEVLQRRNVDNTLIRRIKSFYKICRNYVRTGNTTSDEFITTQGVRQGDILSPYLFIILMDDVIKRCKESFIPMCIGNWNMQTVKVTLLAYADDVTIMAKSAESLQHNINIFTVEMTRRGLSINTKKSETMIISRAKTQHQIHIGSETLKQVEQFRYLGVTISDDGKPDKDLNRRISATSNLYFALNKNFIAKREVSANTKLAVYNSTYIPTLTYGCESWAHTTRNQSRIQASEMKYLRRVAGKTRRDRIRNDTIRANLSTEPINNKIERNKLRWFGHVARMPENRLPKRVSEARPCGTRSRGRRRVTWQDTINNILTERGIEPRTARSAAQDRTKWRNLCKNLYTAR